MLGKKKTSKLEINVLSHEMVPKMEILSDSQKEKVLKEYSINETQLPKIDVTDPSAEALGAKVGDVIKIHRKDPTAKYLYYRFVI